MRHVFETMGTVASVDGPAELMPSIEACFEEFEARFSLYRPDSELSRIARGDLLLSHASEALLATYMRAIQWRGLTNGSFTPHRPDGVIDLNGIVKAEAIDAAGAVFDAAGCTDWTINVGGDILTRRQEPIGIVDPHRRDALLLAVILTAGRRAMATSGSAERGDHIWLGGSIGPSVFAQVTVIADDIVTADVLATAIVAAGPDGLDDLTERWPIDVVTVDREGIVSATPGLRSALVGAAANGTETVRALSPPRR